MNPETLEGRLLAHRRILQLIVGELAGSEAGARIAALLRKRSTLQDGQEDPGAVETEGMGIELEIAQEFNRIAEGLPKSAQDASTQGTGGAEGSGGSLPPGDPPRV